jgi:hypothetical protein
MADHDWKNLQEHSLAAWLMAITTALSVMLAVCLPIYMGSGIRATPDHDPLVAAAFLFFTIPLVGLAGVNILLLLGVRNKRTAALAFAGLVLPIEWMFGIVLGGNAISSGLFNGKQYVSSVPYHHTIQAVICLLLVAFSWWIFGREIYKSRHKS